MLRTVFAFVLAFVGLGIAPAEAQRRLALVIGIAEYRELPRIVRPAGDARAVRDALVALGFEADLVIDPDQRALDDAIDRFAGSVQRDDTALVYYSGHAARIRDDFVLLPVEALPQGTREEDRRRVRGLGLYALADDLKAAGAGAQVVIVDACRGDPYAGDAAELAPSSCGEVGRQMPEGSFVLFAASTGQKALDRLGPDDRDPHSLFTRTLLRRLPEARAMPRLARVVREDVVEAAAGVNYEQRPSFLDEVAGPPIRLVPREQDVARAPPRPPEFPPERARPLPAPEVPAERRAPAEAFRCGAIVPGPPAFSCRRVRGGAEAAICADPRLGSCDRVLNEVFERAEARLGPGAPGLRREEDAWLLRRNACAEIAPPGSEALATCIGRAYDRRIAELEAIAAGPAPALRVARPSFDCRAARTPVEQAICADPRLAARDRQMARLYEEAILLGDPRLERVQDAWRAARDGCARAAALEACVAELYDRRIRELRALVAVR